MNDSPEEFLRKATELNGDALLESFETQFPNRSREFSGTSKETRVSQYRKAKSLRRQMLTNRVPFITPEFYPDFFLCQGLILVGGRSGHGKSTTAANVVAGFLRHTSGTCIVITNEEASDSILDRVSCIIHEQDYKSVYSLKMPEHTRLQIEETSEILTERIEIIEDGAFQPNFIEDVIAVLEHAAKNRVSMVVIDYFQTVNQSRLEPNKESYAVLKDFGYFLKDYGRRYGVPIVCFTQLRSKGESPEFQARVENDKTIFNHAFVAIEVNPDFGTGITRFIVHKDRFGRAQGKEVQMKYKQGRYEIHAPDSL